ncbi:chemotaxis protein CheA [Acidithiobacillus sp. AMEEHan]|uniref:chemotaxis protein CheA n=1 Tax=Acidithiobacillus sp. AMEEHan TaxID=2994951 RepID=UPI0027E5AD94|nr:chemotaxis protein CheA [Acidithiobacillus sp. AMEEHan]
MMDIDPALQGAMETFFEESRDLLQEMEQILLGVETHGLEAEQLNALFRAAHTIKGSAGLFGLDPLVRFTHRLENLLDRIRAGQQAFDAEQMVPLLLACADHLGAYLVMLQGADAFQPDFLAEDVRLLEALEAVQRRQAEGILPGLASDHPAPPVVQRAYKPAAPDQPRKPHRAGWHISLRFGVDTFRDGMDPLSFLQYLRQMGEILGLVTLTDQLPKLSALDPESCYLGFEIAFASAASKAEIVAVFDFVKDSCTLHILPSHDQLPDYLRMIESLPEADQRIGEILVAIGSLTPEELQQALGQQQEEEKHSGEHHPLGEILVAAQMVPEPLVQGALAKQQQQRGQRQMLRIHAEELDQLVDLVGELVIASASNRLRAQEEDRELRVEAAVQVARLVEEIRDRALHLRMIEVNEIFQRFPRVVRDTAKQLSKDIRLEIRGEQTELDKSMAEKIVDPLMHLVRNAMDHGIESAAIRQASGKDPQGRILLQARHDASGILIEVQDDGAGLQRDKILRKAIEKGLVQEDQKLSDTEVFSLIFAPGFSTAEKISDISGRGVGMDVVKQNIESIRGGIDIESQPGQGTTIRIRLPLTLSIIDGFVVRIGKGLFVIPSDAVEECVEYPQVEATGYLQLRGQPLPLLDLAAMFQVERSVSSRRNVIVVGQGSERIGVLVGAILGNQQTVIKPLGRLFESLPGISAATILGNGELAPILDIAHLLQHHTRSSRTAQPTSSS